VQPPAVIGWPLLINAGSYLYGRAAFEALLALVTARQQAEATQAVEQADSQDFNPNEQQHAMPSDFHEAIASSSADQPTRGQSASQTTTNEVMQGLGVSVVSDSGHMEIGAADQFASLLPPGYSPNPKEKK
jgi:hypothetical protein